MIIYKLNNHYLLCYKNENITAQIVLKKWAAIFLHTIGTAP